jgi:S-adenosyl methyltransferase
MTDKPLDSAQEALSKIDTSVPHSARIWNYWLGGKDSYQVDRTAGDAYSETFPGIIDIARHTRRFLARSVRYLADEAGISQFLDIGTGLPTADNTHQIAQRVNPAARIVYVDNDPLVLTHARALLTSTPEGVTRYIDCDMRDSGTILEEAAKTFDLGQPVAVTINGVLGHTNDYGVARSIVRGVLEGLPSGSYLALADSTTEDEAFNKAQQGYDDTGAIPYKLWSLEEITGFFDGLELVEPGVVRIPRWRPESPEADDGPGELPALAGVGRKP